MHRSEMDRRDFLKLGMVAGTVTLMASLMPGFSLADAKKITLEECLGMTPEQMAENSKVVMDSWEYLKTTAVSISDLRVRGIVLDILNNPAPTFVAPIRSGNARQAIWEELKAKALLDGVPLEEFLPAVQDPARSPQPFFSAPGSGYFSHHAYPGGVVTHTALNVKVSLALYDSYREIYGFELNRDVVVASQMLHDLHKAWVFQWGNDGASRTELTLAGTGEHHCYSIAESIYRGLPPEICIAQACAHNHPGSPKDESDPVNWIKAASILVGVNPVENGFLDKKGDTLPTPRRVENFVCHLGDHDWVVTVPAVKWLLPEMQSIAAKRYKMTDEDLKGKKFHSFRNYVFSWATAMGLYQLWCAGGSDALTETVESLVVPA